MGVATEPAEGVVAAIPASATYLWSPGSKADLSPLGGDFPHEGVAIY